MEKEFKDIWACQSFITEDQKILTEFQVDVVTKILEAREIKGISRAKLAKEANLKQDVVARVESMQGRPQLETILKILKPLGYKLAVVKI